MNTRFSAISLNGTWKFTPIFDQKPFNRDKGLLYANPKLDRTDWDDVPVPGVWQRYAIQYRYFEGVCWFYKEFALENAGDLTAVMLDFGGVDHKADVYVNNIFVGTHESAYTAFSFNITKYVKEGINALAVRVDNTAAITKWPNDWGYGMFGGLHRDVALHIYRSAYLEDLRITPDFDTDTKEGILQVSGIVSGDAGEIKVILGDDARIVSVHDGCFSEVLRYPAVLPWSVKQPVLYDAAVIVDGEVFKETKVGFRHVSTVGRKLCINGEATHLNGTCYVYDCEKYGLVMNREQLTEDLTKMKEAHITAIRTHYAMDELFYRLCDEMGFYVWIEPNVYCSRPENSETNTVFAREDYIENAINMTMELIAAARSHPCVIIYGIGNECNVEHAETPPFFKKLASTVREADPTRLIGYASLYGIVGCVADLVDIMGINAYYGWYGTFPEFETADEKKNGICAEIKLDELDKTICAVKEAIPQGVPILMTEFGADSVPGFISEKKALWSEDYHAELLTRTVELLRKHEEVVGQFVFAFTDYSDPSKPKNGHWNGYNLKGLLTYGRDEKKPYAAIREMYGNNK